MLLLIILGKQNMKKFIPLATLGLAVSFASPAVFSADDAEDSKYIEEIIVTGERGETSSLDRAMTVTGFNSALIEKLGIQNTNDLEVLVPGLQVGVQSTAGKVEDGHLVMRGVANDRRVNFFQDTSVAVYIDGVYSPTTYGLNGGTFDVERIEVSRGPQGTTGGKTAIAGAISFVTKKPTEEWDFKATAEFTDQNSQEFSLAFGGPIGDSGFSYRLGLNSLTGDGFIKNIGLGPDAGEPDRLNYMPQLRYTSDRWDITARYNKLEDTGVQRVGLTIGARDTITQFQRNADGTPRCVLDRTISVGECQLDDNGNPIYYINPGFGLGQNPAVVNCPGFNNDGTRDPGLPVVCEGDKLTNVIELNAPIGEDNSQESFSIEAHFSLNDTHDIVYRYGDRDTRTNTDNDSDQTNRSGGGVCLAQHPRVISGELQEGQTHPRCALDGQGDGAYVDAIGNYIRSSDQISHEISLISNNDGPLNYTIGYTYLEGDEPYVFRDFFNGVETGNNSLNNPIFYTDTSAACEAGYAGNALPDALEDQNDPRHASATSWIQGCYGGDWITNYSEVTNGFTLHNGSGNVAAFYGNTEYEQAAVYANVEYVLSDEWKLFGGLRYNDDHKEHNQNDFTSAFQTTLADGTVVNAFNAIFRGKNLNATANGYVGIELDAQGFPIPDDRTYQDSKIANWTKTTWNIGAEYTPTDNTMWYGRISSGYRVGGFSGFGNGLGEAHDPEEMINYEGGIKGLFFDNAVQLEVSVYFQDFDAFWAQAQRLRTPAELASQPPGGSAFIGESQAISGTEIAGIEAQGAWQINDRLVLRGFYEHMYSSFGDFSTAYCCTPAGESPPGTVQEFTDANGRTEEFSTRGLTNFGGHSLRMQPENKLSATLTYDVPVNADWGSLDVTTIMSWRDTMYPDEGNLDIMEIPSYLRWDLRANWTSPSGTYEVSGWVTNVLDLIQVQSYSPRDGNGVTAPVNGTITDERRVGVTFNYQL
jgi:outer membrane receptor protein involved in Fe transport